MVVKIGGEIRIKVLIIEDKKEPVIGVVWNDLDTMRNIIGNSNLEVAEYNDILVIYDKTSLAKSLPINRHLDDFAIRGTFILAGNDEKEFDFKSLTNEQISNYIEKMTLNREEELEL